MSVSLLAVAAVALSVLFARNRQPAPELAKEGVPGAAVSLEDLRRAGF